MSPQRIQRQRTKGWRMPDGAVYVGRPTKWGNPYLGEGAVATYRARAEQSADAIRAELAGKDLACWCPLSSPCHGDVLLELANAGEPS